MFKLLVIAALVAVGHANPLRLSLSLLNPYTPNGRIVDGERVSIEEVPHQVSMQLNGDGFCGGAIIAKDWVLTAGHCADYTSVISVKIRAGTNNITSGGSVHEIEKFIIHEKYEVIGGFYKIPINDIALVKLKTPFVFDSTRKPAELFEMHEEVFAGKVAMVTGWGDRHIALRKVSIPVVGKKECNNAYAYYFELPAGQICAAHPDGGKGFCGGDSGGPLTIDGRLAGIVSWSNGCGKPGYPGVYTEVASYRDWIHEKTGL